jgi:hypothetical protein
MYKLILLFLMTPLVTFAQDEKQSGFYLNAKNEITTTKSDFKCMKNKELSGEYLQCYDCLDAQQKIAKQLHMNLHISAALKNEVDPIYLHTTDHGDYLTGDLKDGKPYNGFFKQVNGDSLWLIFDYYKDGKLIEQWYNDFFNLVMAEQDNQTALITIDKKNSFINGVLADGIEVTPAWIKHGGGDIVRTVKNSKTAAFRIGLFAVNAVEMISVTPITHGYLLEHAGKNGMRITFTPGGRKIEDLTPENKTKKITVYSYYDFSEQDKVDKKRFHSYFQKNNKLYLEQAKEAGKEGQENEKNDSRILRRLAMYLYDDQQLDTAFFKNFLADKNDGLGVYMGNFGIYEGQASGFVYNTGDSKGKYTLDYYTDGKIQPWKSDVKNKTLQELTEILKSLR